MKKFLIVSTYIHTSQNTMYCGASLRYSVYSMSGPWHKSISRCLCNCLSLMLPYTVASGLWNAVKKPSFL